MWQFLRRFLGFRRKEEADGFQPGKLPQHIAIIMDGNGRWAQNRGLPRTVGHREGMESIRQVVGACAEHGIKVLTLYAFSTENWRRPWDEVEFLMNLPEVYLSRELPRLQKNNVRVCAVGRVQELPLQTRRVLDEAVEATAGNTGLILNIAINYGGRAEIIDAVRTLSQQVKQGYLSPEDISEDMLAAQLYNPQVRDPDLLIRTGGETRISNFLLWQIAYTELWFTPVLWPDFGEKDLKEALAAYQMRERRFGSVPRQKR